jgi:flavin-binding protein dodecin
MVSRIANRGMLLASFGRNLGGEQLIMGENVYKVIELVGTSTESWEKATAAAITRAGKTLRDLRVAEVVKLDVQLKDGKVEAFRSRISVSFKYESKG